MGWDLPLQTHIGEVWTVQKPDSFFFQFANDCSPMVFGGGASAAPSNAGLTGAFGKQLFELRRSEFLIAARQAE